MWPFTPRYLKHARLLLKGVTRFINYKRDILPAAKLSEVEKLRDDLKSAIKAGDRAKIDALHDTINDTCSKALPDYRNSEIGDNVEVFFVAIVVALGIRGYIAQPFQIPTASMRPTLNGYMAEPTEQDPTPNIAKVLWDKTSGATYINVVADHTGFLDQREAVTEHHFLLIFTYSTINFADGHSIRVWAPKAQIEGSKFADRPEAIGLGFAENVGAKVQVAHDANGREVLTPDAQPVRIVQAEGQMVKEGQLLARGILRSGDHVLVNKFAYHFRRPTRGEVFVFTTKHIAGIEGESRFDKRMGSQHYIKRLVGVPGDTLQVKTPELWINGKPAEEFGMKRVAHDGPPYPGYEERGYLGPNRTITLDQDEYWAMGDNSPYSSDSRYWGHVPQQNIVGSALFCYFPFTAHWGPIW